MKIPVWFDPTVKVIATLVAVFGVWRFFDERAEEAQAAREQRSLSYISRFANTEMVAARQALLDFWRRYPEFAAEVQSRSLTSREYEGFVNAAYPADPARGDVDRALYRILVFYDELAFCHRAGICDETILLDFFCDYAPQHERIYAPFHMRLASEIGTRDLGRHLKVLTDTCRQ